MPTPSLNMPMPTCTVTARLMMATTSRELHHRENFTIADPADAVYNRQGHTTVSWSKRVRE